MSKQLKLTENEVLELEMANARGGNDWTEALEAAGNDMLNDLLVGRRLVVFAKRIIRGEYGPAAVVLTGNAQNDITAIDDWLRREAKEALGIEEAAVSRM
jgi:hypothetical protein